MQPRLSFFFLSESNTLKERQHGFRTYKGTLTSITTRYERIAKALAEKKQACMILRDVAKAFDEVMHHELKYV